MNQDCHNHHDLNNIEMWYNSIIAAIIVLILFSPPAFALSDLILRNFYIRTISKYRCPTIFGLVFHAFIFIFIDRFLLTF